MILEKMAEILFSRQKHGVIKTVVYWVIALFLCLPVLWLSWVNYQHTYGYLTRDATLRVHSAAELSAVTLKEKLDRLSDVGIALASRTSFQVHIENGEWQEAMYMLKNLPRNFDYIERIFISDLSGTLQADYPVIPGVAGKNFAYRDWYKNVSSQWKVYVSEVYKRYAKPSYNVIAVAIPIRKEKEKLIGILVLQVRVDTLLGWSAELPVGESGFVYFIDHHGRLAAHPSMKPESEVVDYSSVKAVKRALVGENLDIMTYSPDKKEAQVSSYCPVPEYGWVVVAQQPASEAFEARDRSLSTMLLFDVIFLSVSFLFAHFIVTSLDLLSRRAQELSLALTDLEKSHEDLKRTQKHLIESEKFKSIGQLAAGVAHEVKNPLATITLGVDYLSSHIPNQTPLMGDLFKDIQMGVDRANKVIRGLMDFAASKTLELKKQDLKLVIDQALLLLRHSVNKSHIQIVEDYEANLPELWIDRMKIEQVLINTVMNASDSMPEGGTLTVRIHKKQLTKAEIQEKPLLGNYFKPDENVINLQIDDSGKGVPAEALEHLFQPFYTTKEFGKGTGLGLSVSRAIMDMHQGYMSIENLPERGARVTLMFKITTPT